MLPLYFAPINALGNPVFRHLLLLHDADFVFSELLQVDRWGHEVIKEKLRVIDGDLPKTIFQIGVSNTADVEKGVSLLIEEFKTPVEININMGCPQSSMQKRKTCGGILSDLDILSEVSRQLVLSCAEHEIIPSVKLRLGTAPDEIKIKEYLGLLRDAGIKKVYVHARTLRYNYTKPAMHEELFSLQDLFPNMELIFNGDIDSFEVTQELAPHCKGLMVGRAALSNPLIFEQIKASQKTILGPYNPFYKDPHHKIIESGKTVIGSEKRTVLAEFMSLTEEFSLRRELRDMNLMYMTKGLSSKSEFIKDISTKSSAQLQKLLHTL